jgi:ABC-type dipeptide/oligopeptide/nickel transport system permease component
MIKKIRNYSGIIILLVLSIFLIFYLNSKTFDIKKFNVENEYHTIKELTKPEYQGRLAGTKGNELACSYVENYFKSIGVKPGGENGTYYQNLKSMVPTHMSKPYMKIFDNNGKFVKEYFIGKDYREMLNGYGGNGEVNTNLLYLKNWIRGYKVDQIKGKVIVVDTLIGDNDIEYAIDHGVKGILCPVVDDIAKTSIYSDKKMGKSILIHMLQKDVYNEILTYTNKNYKISMKLDEQLKYVNTPNIIGKIDGKDKNAGYIIFSSHIDGFGSEFGSNIYYPGAFDGASGTSVVLELAKIFKEQKNKPEKTIIFALWNNEEHGKKGKQYYTENPIYPLADSTVFYLNNFGAKRFYNYRIDSKGQASQILRDKMAQFSKVVLPQNEPAVVQEFTNNGAVAVSFQEALLGFDAMGYVQRIETVGTPDDTIEKISKKRLSEVTNLLLVFIQRELCGDIFSNLFHPIEKIILWSILFSLVFLYIFNVVNRLRPGKKIFGTTIEDIYYSRFYGIFDKGIRYLCQGGLIMTLLVFVTHIPGNLNLFKINGVIHTNFSWSQVIADSLNYLRMLFSTGFGKTTKGMEVWEYIIYAFGKSFALLASVMIVGTIFGIAKGIFDAFKGEEKGNLRALGTIMVFSLPDVFVVITLQMLFIYLYKNNIVNIPREYMEQRLFVEAFLSLIILPSIYIARIAAVAVHEEAKKDYIKAAKAKGLSNFSIIKNHLLISILIKVTESLPSILSLVISNLIIVEYLSSYGGIVTNMLRCYKESEINAYTGLAISLCILYIVFVIIFRIIGKLLNPLKRREL